jgi:hypothetical protein
MKTWLSAAIASLILLVGCGGGLKGNLVQGNPYQASSLSDNETEELGNNEDLYAKIGIPTLEPIQEEEMKKWERQINFDVPIQINKQVRAYLVYFSTKRKEVIQRQLARSTRYLPMIKEVFQEYGLPEDLAYLAMIESGFNPDAQSPAGACGMWQFMKGTGVRYGLIIDGYIDERRDPVKSTRAAARYLQDLYKQFGSWYLAAASYNCGEGRVQRELKQSNNKNFWELSANKCLPSETKNYVPQMIAATIIAKNPEKFKFKDIPYQQPATNFAATSLTDESVAGGKGNQDLAAKPAHSRTIRATSYSPPKSQPCYSAASVTRKPNQNSGNKINVAKKQTPQAIYAKSCNSNSCNASNGNSPPYVASIFGSPASPKKGIARKNKSDMQTTANNMKTINGKVVNSKSKKQSPALFALKSEPKNGKAKTLKKKSSPIDSNTHKIGRTKTKALLVSEAR